MRAKLASRTYVMHVESHSLQGQYLARHKQIHSDVRKHKCSECGKSFTSKADSSISQTNTQDLQIQ